MNIENILKVLKKEFPYIYNDFDTYCKLNDIIITKLEDNLEVKENFYKLSKDEIFSYTEFILKSLDEAYYKEFLKLKKLGIIVIDENEKTKGSFLSVDGKILNLKYTGSFFDVATLIHEFNHYLNRVTCEGKSPINRQCFGETMAISFELYAQKYLITLGIPENLVGLNIRRDFEKKMTNYFKPTLEKLKVCLDDKHFNDETDVLNIKPEEKDFARRIGGHLQHLLGYVLSYYILNNLDIKSIIYLNNNLNDFQNVEAIFSYLKVSLNELLKFAKDDTLSLNNKKNTDIISII